MRTLGNFIAADDATEWTAICCQRIALAIKNKLSHKKNFYLAISGGNTPKVLFEELIRGNYLNPELWQQVHFFWVDERIVPHSSDQSNFGNAMRFLKQLPATFYPMYREELGLDESLEVYEDELQAVPHLNNLPNFDLILLGMGDDGHTASLFPGSAGLEETQKEVFVNEIPSLQTSRITLSFPVLQNANEVFILLNGAVKMKIMQEILEKQTNYPIERIFAGKNSKTWIYYN